MTTSTQNNSFIVSGPADCLAVREKIITFPIQPARSIKQERRLSSALPQIYSAKDLLADKNITLPPQLIHGVLHKGLKAVLGSSSKARKTWMLLDLALSVASGNDWLKWKTTKGKVLVINFEIPLAFLRERIRALANKKECDATNLDVWTLRGHSAPFSELIPELIEEVKEREYDLIIIDPIYKGLGSGDENKAGDIGNLCNELEKLAVKTGAAVLYAHHFSKGNQANKEAIDRFSGSGVFARDADSLIVLTPHENDNCYVVDLILRNFKEQEPFVVEWQYPVMAVKSGLSVTKLKRKGGKPKEDRKDELLGLLKAKSLTAPDWQKKAAKEFGVTKPTFYREKNRLQLHGFIVPVTVGKQEKWTIAN